MLWCKKLQDDFVNGNEFDLKVCAKRIKLEVNRVRIDIIQDWITCTLIMKRKASKFPHGDIRRYRRL